MVVHDDDDDNIRGIALNNENATLQRLVDADGQQMASGEELADAKPDTAAPAKNRRLTARIRQSRKHYLTATNFVNGMKLRALSTVFGSIRHDSVADEKKKKAENAKEARPPEFREATLLEVFRYADALDYVLLAVGVLTSFAAGAGWSFSTCVFRGMSDLLICSQQLSTDNVLVMDKFQDGILYYVRFYFLLGVFDFIAMFFSMGCMFTVCERQVDKIRDKFFRAVLVQDAAWFDRNQAGALTQKMTSGIEQIKYGMSDKLAIIIQAIGVSFSGIIIAFIFDWKMTLASLSVAPFIILSVYGSKRAVSSSLRVEMDAYAAAGAVANEVLSGVRTVHSFNAQSFEASRYEKCLEKGRTMGIRKAIRVAFFSGLYIAIFFASSGLMFGFGTYMVFEGMLTPGTVFAVFWLVFVGALRLGEAMPQINVLVAAKLSAGEIFSIIDRQPSPDCSSNAGIKLKDVKGRIEFCNVHFTYPTRPDVRVLNGVSFTVESGESVALVGHSGCGKSTIISLLMRYYDFSHGTITVDGLPLRDLNINWLRNTIGVVSQEPVIFAATIEENLRLGNPDATLDEMMDACRMANAHEFIMKLESGYQTVIGDGGVKLSGGEKQRLSIARALVRHPKILLLDEATSALDSENENIVQHALEQASSGRTTITIAHRLSTIRNADKILVFERGNIVEAGTHEQLLQHTDGVYRQLCAAQEIAREMPEFESELSADEGTVGSPIKRSVSTRESGQMARVSARIRQSLVSIKQAADFEADDVMEELEDEGAKPASAFDILRFARPEHALIVAGVLMAIFLGISMPCFSALYGRTFMIMSKVYDRNVTNITTSTMENNCNSIALVTNHSTLDSDTAINAILYVALGIFAGLTLFGSGALLSIVGERMTMRLRSLVFRNLLRQDGTYFDDRRHVVGKLTMRLANDAPNVQSAIDQRLAGALQGVASLITAIGAAFYVGWNVAPVGLSVALLLLFIQAGVSSYLQRRGARDSDVADSASKIAAESIEYVRTVQALTRQEFQHNAFCTASRIPHRLAVIRSWWQSVGYALSFSFMPFNFGVVYMVGMYMISANLTTPYIVFQVVEMLNMAAFTIMRTASYFPEYVRGKLSAGLMFSMVAETPKIDSLADSGQLTPIQGNIEANAVYFAYPNANQKLVLRGLSLNAPHGTTVALVGPSGCGKSTIIQLLERFYNPLNGNLSIDGTDVSQFNIRHLRASMALVGQEPTLFNLTVRENIAYGLETITDAQIIEAAKLANIHSFIDSLPDKYETSVGAKGTQLSGGQKQRIAIARAIIRNPKILLLDEATSALDTESEKVVQEALERARFGRTCIVIAHRLSTIQNADLIVVMKEGRVQEMGTHQQLLARGGLYYRLVQRQSE